MGNIVTKEQSVNIEDIEEVTCYTDYTVLRTSGTVEPGWILNRLSINPEWVNKSAYYDVKAGTWRIYTQNGKEDPNVFLHAWRSLEKIYPTILEGNKGAIEDWRTKVFAKLEVLEAQREKVDIIGAGIMKEG